MNICLLLSGSAQDVIEQIIQPDKITFPKSTIFSNNFSIEWDLTVNIMKSHNHLVHGSINITVIYLIESNRAGLMEAWRTRGKFSWPKISYPLKKRLNYWSQRLFWHVHMFLKTLFYVMKLLSGLIMHWRVCWNLEKTVWVLFVSWSPGLV